jgi:hypothetical protein
MSVSRYRLWRGLAPLYADQRHRVWGRTSMSDDEKKSEPALVNVTVNVPDILGMKDAGPAIQRAIDLLSEAVASGIGVLRDSSQTALEALAERFSQKQRLLSKAESLEMMTVAIEKLPLPVREQRDAIRYVLAQTITGHENRERTARRAFSHAPRERDRLLEAPKIERVEKAVEPDWLTLFWRCASEKSHPELQDIFARILAREAFEPGVISPATLHVMSILDAESARAIERLCNLSARNVVGGNCFLLDPSNLRFRDESDPPDLFDFGISDEDLMLAEQFGLIARHTIVAFDRDDDGATFEIGHRRFSLKLPKKFDGSKIEGIPLSTMGVNFRSLIALKSDDRYVDAILKMLRRVKVELTELKATRR